MSDWKRHYQTREAWTEQRCVSGEAELREAVRRRTYSAATHGATVTPNFGGE